MNEPWYWYGRLGGALVCGAVGAVLWTLSSPDGALRARWQCYLRHLRQDLEFLHAPYSAEQLTLAQVVAAGVALVSAALRLWPFTLTALLLATMPLLLVRTQKHKRVLLIDQQVEAWLVALANALKASPSLGESLISSVSLMRDPIAPEVDRIVKEYHLGTPLDQAFQNAATRVGSRTFAMALATLRIARNTGGDLPQTLATSAQSLREMARLDGVVRTKTAEGKAQAIVISAIPFPLYFMIEWIQPGFFEPLKHSFTGHIVCAIAALLWISAALLAQRILSVDI